MQQQKDYKYTPLKVVIVGHVDHGKSTLIGRLLYDTKSLDEGKYEELKDICKKRGVDLEWSFLLDSFQAERDQAVTIDTTQIWFSSQKRDYVIIDAPGHREFLKNMISGASAADAAILVVDAEEGVRDQTKRHAYLLHLLGLRQIAVVINKMDKVNHSIDRYNEVAEETAKYLSGFGMSATTIIPISARHGDFIARRSEKMEWFDGSSLIDILDSFHTSTAPVARSLRFPVQDVYRFAEKRIIAGRIETGILRKGDRILFSPTNETAVVTSIENWPEDKKIIEAHAGESIGITLDSPIFVERGHVASKEDNPPMLSNVFRANIFWISKNPLKVGNTYKVRFATVESMVTVQSIERVIDTDDLSHYGEKGEVKRNTVAEITLRARNLLPLDPYIDNFKMGRMALYEDYDIAGGGIISMEGYPDQRRSEEPRASNIYKVSYLVDQQLRAERNGHYGSVIWLTGLSGAGKSTLAIEVEKKLFERGYNVYVLDGDNVRYGLNSDLAFSPEDRAENIRRVGEVAALMADAGLIVVTAFISPYRADRERARKAAPSEFNEIFVKADLSTCESRDPKGLYKKAREGEIKNFTGIDAPYEEPENPELIVDTATNDVGFCVEQIVRFIEQSVKSDKKSQNGTDKIKALATA